MLNSVDGTAKGVAATATAPAKPNGAFTGTSVDAVIFTTTDNKTFIAVDADGTGTFNSVDYLIEITGSTVTSITSTTFI